MSDPLPKKFEGNLIADPGARFAIVSSRFNELIVDPLVSGAQSTLVLHGVPEDNITHVRVPGAWELSFTCVRLAGSGKFAAVIALGAVIRGATAHFDFVAGEAARGVAEATSKSGVPVIFGVLTTDTIEQALERAGTKAGNKGRDAAITALEMANLARDLSRHGL